MLVGAVLAAQAPAPRTVRSEVRAAHGIVAAGRTLTVDAGARLLAAGGNAPSSQDQMVRSKLK